MNIPRGLHDLLPEEVLKRRYLENKMVPIFEGWGYQEIITPTFEFYEILAESAGPVLKNEMIKFVDREGNIVALRPEMTTPIARVVSTKLKGEPRPLRFYYISNVFRYDDLKIGDRKEFSQAGVEIIGVKGKEADAEVIALAVECLINSGLEKFCIDIGHANFFNGIMQSMKIENKDKQEIHRAILNKDFVLLGKILSLKGVEEKEKELILKMPTLRGALEVLEKAHKMANNELSRSALNEIKDVYNRLIDYGLEKYVLIDLGIIRDFHYYTGIIFEGYTEYLGFPICSGGRYDNLCSKFGEDLPSTGFAIGLERLAMILERERLDSFKLERPIQYLIYYQNNSRYFRKAICAAKYLRNKGQIVELEIGKLELAEAINYALSKGIKYVAIIDNNESNEIKRIEVLSGKEETITYG